MHAPQLQYSNLMTGGLGLWMNDFLFLLLTTLQFSLVFYAEGIAGGNVSSRRF